jgi:glyoxylase-like metal-dependent hydrolase (beta-lactamase superfamily II)
LTDRVWGLIGPTNSGILVADGGRAAVIDPGLDESSARKVLRLLNEQGLKAVAIINTHAHADHIGGDRFLHARTGAPVYASSFEATVVRNPVWEPIYLAAGALPGGELESKFFMAEAVADVRDLPAEAARLDLGEGLVVEVVPLPGHAYGQVGLAYDGVLFTADAFFPPAILAKHGVPFCVDVQAALASLATLNSVAARYRRYVPGHGQALDGQGLSESLAANREAFDRLRWMVLEVLAQPRTLDDLMAALATRIGLSFAGVGQYYLVRTGVTAILTDLERRGLVAWQAGGPILSWSATGR